VGPSPFDLVALAFSVASAIIAFLVKRDITNLDDWRSDVGKRLTDLGERMSRTEGRMEPWSYGDYDRRGR